MPSLNEFPDPFELRSKLSLVKPLPWHFAGNGYEVFFEIEPSTAKELLPPPLSLSRFPGLLSVVFSDMVSTSHAQDMVSDPYACQYQECLVKIHCQYDGQAGWYVPLSFVDKDFSLVRGIFQGFPKRIATISMTRFHTHHSQVASVAEFGKVKALADRIGAGSISLELEVRGSGPELPSDLGRMYVMRHIPDITTPGHPLVHDLCELSVRDHVKVQLAAGDGFAEIETVDAFGMVTPKKFFGARAISEGFTLTGARSLYSYINLN